MFGYRFSYIIFRPWKLIRLTALEIKYAWQRVWRGWDDQEMWNYYSYFLKRTSQMLARLSANPMGHPPELTYNEWQKTLMIMAIGFEKAQKWIDHETRASEDLYKRFGVFANVNDEIKKFKEETKYEERHQKEMNDLEKIKDVAFELFNKWFWHLWD